MKKLVLLLLALTPIAPGTLNARKLPSPAAVQKQTASGRLPATIEAAETAFADYRFDEAVKLYESILSTPKLHDSIARAVNPRLAQARIGQRMLHSVEDVQITDSLQIDKSDLLRLRLLGEEYGKLFHTSDYLHRPQPSDCTGFATERGNLVIYADTTTLGTRNLFASHRWYDGWTPAEPLAGAVNTAANENYPFLMPDGITLYYASDNPAESLGGYDLFITRLSPTSGKYLQPESLGMPFNSPYNDYLLLIDKTAQKGWFISDRYQPEGKAMLYTFTPNPYKKILETDNKETLRRAARLK